MRQHKTINSRPNDYPELQIGFPERNDVCNPELERERIHVNPENMRLSKKSASELLQETKVRK